MELVIGTKNINKVKEIKAFFENNEVSIVSLPNNIDDVIEDGKTILENANKKALTYAKTLNKIVLADDTGLFIKSLNNAPGINSNRYSNLGPIENNKKVLTLLKGIKNRKAYFLTIISIAFPNGKIFNYKAKLKGTIIQNPSSLEGFGYDPIFIPKGYSETLSELGLEFKLKYSHRSKALAKVIKNIKMLNIYNETKIKI